MNGAPSTRYIARHASRRSEVIVEEIDPANGRYAVTIDGRRREIEWRSIVSRRAVSALVDGVFQREFVLRRESPERISVVTGKRTYVIDCVEALVAEAREAVGTAASVSGEEITAPIPGRVVKLLVAVGDRIEPGAPVLILEAMKMQNELRAVAGGVVSEIRCRERDAVESGAVMVVIGAGAE